MHPINAVRAYRTGRKAKSRIRRGALYRRRFIFKSNLALRRFDFFLAGLQLHLDEQAHMPLAALSMQGAGAS